MEACKPNRALALQAVLVRGASPLLVLVFSEDGGGGVCVCVGGDLIATRPEF